jgi:peptidoglycan/LPS O-acetylase OafA/YrhL
VYKEQNLIRTAAGMHQEGRMKERVDGYDFIRSVVILLVFLAHILDREGTSGAVLLTVRSLSPGLTMSLLGFLSALLVSPQKDDFGSFLIKRFTRIYISLAVCLFVVLSAHALLGKKVFTQHVLLHAMGLSAFFGWFQVQNRATIGAGLWFITAINLMYLFLPLLQRLFRHPRGFLHLAVFVALCTTLNFVMYGAAVTWGVIISFAVGVYLDVNGQTSRLIGAGMTFPLVGSLGLLVVAALSTAGVLPYSVRGFLFALYPLALVPVLLAICKKLPRPIVAASSFFSSLSYEFYILHFYFINQGFGDFFPPAASLDAQIIISFITTFAVAYVISHVASRFRRVANGYLLAIGRVRQ